MPTSVWSEITVVRNLVRGKSKAIEAAKIGPAPEANVELLISKMRKPLADLLRLMLATGMRPAEACGIRPQFVDRSGPVWIYRVPDEWNKTEHHDIERFVAIGPRGQAILGPRIEKLFDKSGPIFMNKFGNAYDPQKVSAVVREACKRLGIKPWTPNQLRHNFATAVRRHSGLEAAQVCLGHEDAETTQIYAEKDMGLAVKVAMEMG